jgi:hypothetical protein
MTVIPFSGKPLWRVAPNDESIPKGEVVNLGSTTRRRCPDQADHETRRTRPNEGSSSSGLGATSNDSGFKWTSCRPPSKPKRNVNGMLKLKTRRGSVDVGEKLRFEIEVEIWDGSGGGGKDDDLLGRRCAAGVGKLTAVSL